MRRFLVVLDRGRVACTPPVAAVELRAHSEREEMMEKLVELEFDGDALLTTPGGNIVVVPPQAVDGLCTAVNGPI